MTPYAGIVCHNHGRVDIDLDEYMRQMRSPDSLWVCPMCGQVAEFDDDRFRGDQHSGGGAMNTEEQINWLRKCRSMTTDGNAVEAYDAAIAALGMVNIAKIIQDATGCGDSDSIYAASAVLKALAEMKP